MITMMIWEENEWEQFIHKEMMGSQILLVSLWKVLHSMTGNYWIIETALISILIQV